MITFTNVTRKFGETEALSEVSFQIDKGELVLITGPSGSGKTSLMRLLIKEYEPTSGEILFDGEPLTRVRGGAIAHHRRRIGVVFQDYKLLPELNVWENIALPLSIVGKSQAETESRVTDLLKLVGLTEKAMLFPSQLSGGEAQRVSIARALATGPGIIFADEPTGNLDPETSLSIARLLRQINRLGTTLLLATHDNEVLALLSSERRISLHKGKLDYDSHPKAASQVTELQLTDKNAKSAASNPDDTDKEEAAQIQVENLPNEQSDDLVTEVEDLDDDAVEISIHHHKSSHSATENKKLAADKSHKSKKTKPEEITKKSKHTSETKS